jgi:hypothetical protein
MIPVRAALSEGVSRLNQDAWCKGTGLQHEFIGSAALRSVVVASKRGARAPQVTQ